MNNKRASTRLNSKLKTKREKNQKAKSENKRKAQTIIKKSFPLPPQPENYKQINYIDDIGKLELVDYKGNITECDIYGSPKKKFLNDITGITTFKERLDKGLIKEFKYNNNKSLYIPKTLNFEGSSMFPRPLSLPFVSQMENPRKLVTQVKKEGRAMVNKNIKIFSLNKPIKDKSIIPSFICHKIGKNYPNERNYLIKLIDNYISEKKEEYKFDNDYIQKSPQIKSLNNYKKKLNENMTNELYNGKLISASNQKDLMLKYDSIRKAIYNNGLRIYKTSNNVEGKKIINFDIYRKLYKIKGVGNKKSLFKQSNIINNDILLNKNNSYIGTDARKLSYSEENVKYKTLYSKKNDINSMRKTFSIFSKNNKKLNLNKEKMKKKYNNECMINDEKFKKTITTEFDKNNDESLTTNTFYINTEKNNLTYKNNNNLYTPNNLFTKNKNVNSNNNTSNLEKYNKTANTFYKTKTSLKKINQTNQSNSNIISYTEKDNCSYTSEETKNDKNSNKKFKKGFNFKSIRDINNRAYKENTLLKGFLSPKIREEKEFKMQKNKKKDTTLKHYIDELELIKKVNKIQVEKEKRINAFRDNLLRKKIEGKIIFEFNQKK
jgi:hypothetical protein